VSVLRNLEAKLEGLVGGAFSRAFKSRVQPVEIARKLAKEMADNQTVSISRTYVPNHYTVYLSPQDREQFEGYEEGLKKELSDYLLEHARTEGLALNGGSGFEQGATPENIANTGRQGRAKLMPKPARMTVESFRR